MRFIKKILLAILLLCISFLGSIYGNKIPLKQTVTVVNELYLSSEIPNVAKQYYSLDNNLRNCLNCEFYKNTFLPSKIIDSSPILKGQNLEIHQIKSTDQKSYYCIIKETEINNNGFALKKIVKHFSETGFRHIMETKSESEKISLIKSRDSDLPISIKVDAKPESEVFIFNNKGNSVAKKLASQIFSNKKQQNSFLLKEEVFSTFNSLAINKNNLGNEMITIYKAPEMKVNNDEIIADKSLTIISLSNTQELLKKYNVTFVRDYGFILLRPVSKIVCWLLDSIIIFSNYSSWSLFVFSLLISLILLPAIYYDALYKYNTQKIDLRKELLKTKKSNDPARYESELAKLTQSQLPYFGKYVLSAFSELALQFSCMMVAIPFSYPLRFVKFLWIQDLFSIEGYSIFNLYGLVSFIPPFFLKNIGALSLAALIMIMDNIDLQDEKQSAPKWIMFLAGAYICSRLYVAQLIVLVLLRIFGKIQRSIFQKYLEKKDLLTV